MDTATKPTRDNPRTATPGTLPASERRRILRERAAVLARPFGADETAAEETEIVLFTLGDSHYAIECHHVVETYSMRELTVLPSAPSHVLGIVNFRGQIVPVIGLHQVLNLNSERGAMEKILVTETQVGPVAVHIDSLVGVQNVPREHTPAIPSDANTDAAFFRGLTPEGVPVIDIEHVIASTRLMPNETDESVEADDAFTEN